MAQVREELDAAGAAYEVFETTEQLAEAVAAELAAGKIVGHFAGRADEEVGIGQAGGGQM
jgi:predicted NodU family carbamoyl transferase